MLNLFVKWRLLAVLHWKNKRWLLSSFFTSFLFYFFFDGRVFGIWVLGSVKTVTSSLHWKYKISSLHSRWVLSCISSPFRSRGYLSTSKWLFSHLFLLFISLKRSSGNSSCKSPNRIAHIHIVNVIANKHQVTWLCMEVWTNNGGTIWFCRKEYATSFSIP